MIEAVPEPSLVVPFDQLSTRSWPLLYCCTLQVWEANSNIRSNLVQNSIFRGLAF